PDARDPIEWCVHARARGAQPVVQRILYGVRLHVTPHAQRARDAHHEWPVLFAPVALEIGEREIGETAQSEIQADHRFLLRSPGAPCRSSGGRVPSDIRSSTPTGWPPASVEDEAFSRRFSPQWRR